MFVAFVLCVKKGGQALFRSPFSIASPQHPSNNNKPNNPKPKKVPVAAATYGEDMYVDYDLAQETAGRVGALRQWTTNEYKHSGIRDDGARIFDRLMGLARDVLLLE